MLINNELIDMEARVCFKAGVTAGMLKCCYGVNQYGNRDKQINPNKTEEYPRYSREETQSYIVQYNANLLEVKVDFIIKLYTKLIKVKIDTIDIQTIKDIIADIREFLRNGNEYRTN